MTKRVLGTGGSGYIAGFVVRQLIKEGCQVNATIRSERLRCDVRSVLPRTGCAFSSPT